MEQQQGNVQQGNVQGQKKTSRNNSEVSLPTMAKVFGPTYSTFKPNEFIYFDLKCNKPYFFSGTNSEYVLQHRPKKQFIIAGEKFSSIDEFMWTMKFRELANSGIPSKEERQDMGLTMFLLNRHFVTKQKIESWFLRRGFLYLQKAILRRVQMDKQLYNNLCMTGDRFLVYSYVNDLFLGTGQTMNDLRNWMKQKMFDGVTYKIPKKFPLQVEDLKHLPLIGSGRNVLGAIYMALRETIKDRDPCHMEVKIPSLSMEELAAPYPHQFKPSLMNKKRKSCDNAFIPSNFKRPSFSPINEEEEFKPISQNENPQNAPLSLTNNKISDEMEVDFYETAPPPSPSISICSEMGFNHCDTPEPSECEPSANEFGVSTAKSPKSDQEENLASNAFPSSNLPPNAFQSSNASISMQSVVGQQISDNSASQEDDDISILEPENDDISVVFSNVQEDPDISVVFSNFVKPRPKQRNPFFFSNASSTSIARSSKSVASSRMWPPERKPMTYSAARIEKFHSAKGTPNSSFARLDVEDKENMLNIENEVEIIENAENLEEGEVVEEEEQQDDNLNEDLDEAMSLLGDKDRIDALLFPEGEEAL